MCYSPLPYDVLYLSTKCTSIGQDRWPESLDTVCISFLTADTLLPSSGHKYNGDWGWSFLWHSAGLPHFVSHCKRISPVIKKQNNCNCNISLTKKWVIMGWHHQLNCFVKLYDWPVMKLALFFLWMITFKVDMKATFKMSNCLHYNNWSNTLIQWHLFKYSMMVVLLNKKLLIAKYGYIIWQK